MTHSQLRTLFFSLLFVLSGCGKFDRLDDGGFTKVTFNQNGKKLTSAVINGGLVIYASSNSYSTNLKINDETQTATITLPNGLYKFYAFAYKLGSGPTSLTSDVVCADTLPVALSGASKDVSLTFSRDRCSDGGIFAPTDAIALTGGGAKFFREPTIFPCGSSVNVLSQVPGTNCSNSFSLNWSAVSGAQIILPIYFTNLESGYTKIGEAYKSSCLSGAALSNGNGLSSGFYLPWGVVGSTHRIPMEIELYSDATCNTTLKNYSFPKGIINNANDDSAVGRVDASNWKVFLRQP